MTIDEKRFQNEMKALAKATHALATQLDRVIAAHEKLSNGKKV